MICRDMNEVRLNEYVDGTLAAQDGATVEAHLAGCAGCRAAVAELRRLVEEARGLPRSIEPQRDLWTGVATRIASEQRVGAWRLWVAALAAAATIVLAIALSRLSRPTEGGWAALQETYQRAGTDLAGELEAQRDRLQPGTVALVERNLGIIDAALRESRAALARDPANGELQSLVAAAARQKVELLRWAARVAAS